MPLAQHALMLCVRVLAACGQAVRHKLVPQRCPRTVNDGGAAAALSMALAYYRHPVTQEALQEELWLADGSTDALTMIQSAQAHGVKARGVRVEEKEQLAQLPAGSIVHRKDQRFQVIKKVTGDRVIVLDPFDGRQTLKIDDFWDSFSTVALMFE